MRFTGTTVLKVVEGKIVEEIGLDDGVTALTQLGYRALSAPNANAALRILAGTEHIDLLFTDIVLPKGMNGVELSRVVRELRPQLPVLYTSGYTENAVIHDGRLDPGVQLLEKPFTRAQLAQHIQHALVGSQVSRP